MNSDPFYRKCCLQRFGGCGGTNINGRSIERHHNLIYAGRQVQALFCILPACVNHHARANNPEVKEQFDWVMLNRASEEEILLYSKSKNYSRERDRLNNIHGLWKP